MLVFCSAFSGVILMMMGLGGLGKYVKAVPNSIVVGFAVGIAGVIALSNFGETFGLRHAIKGEFLVGICGFRLLVLYCGYYVCFQC